MYCLSGDFEIQRVKAGGAISDQNSIRSNQDILECSLKIRILQLKVEDQTL